MSICQKCGMVLPTIGTDLCGLCKPKPKKQFVICLWSEKQSRWLYAASDIDWNVLGEKTHIFNSFEEAEDFRKKYCFERCTATVQLFTTDN